MRSRATFAARENDGKLPIAPVLVPSTFLAKRRRVRESEPCRLTMYPALANGFIVGTGREPRVEDSSNERGEPPLDCVSSISWSPMRARELGECSHATNQPKTRPTFRAPRRERTMRTHRDAFHRPSLVRAREDCSSACSSGTRGAFPVLRRRVAASGSRRLFDCPLPSSAAAFAVGSPLTREGGDRLRPFDGWRR